MLKKIFLIISGLIFQLNAMHPDQRSGMLTRQKYKNLVIKLEKKYKEEFESVTFANNCFISTCIIGGFGVLATDRFECLIPLFFSTIYFLKKQSKFLEIREKFYNLIRN
ncbi:hypothetical protein M1446_00420 [Candidatus Dependentiae bacterium]|nr:hypothetical protein [Candidatus Dependentiae bacterium]